MVPSCHQVLEETDLDDDQMLSFIEFEHVISRAPEFLRWLLYISIINETFCLSVAKSVYMYPNISRNTASAALNQTLTIS